LYRFLIADVANAHPSPGHLSTAQLAERTGLPAGTLRMWESRHGFPAPARLPGGHRRYSDDDVASVIEVQRLRGQGLSLSAAIDVARSRADPPPASMFAGLRRRRPEIAPTVLPKRVVLALTRALEDEYCAHATRGALIGSFQRERFYRSAQRRWREIGRSADLAVALADFATLREPAGAPVEVPIDERHPLAREWTLVINAPGAQACLAAWEQPAPAELPDGRRRFEVLWSFEPAVVRAATEVAIEILARSAPAIADRLGAVTDGHGAAPAPDLGFAGALAHRMIDYVGTLVDAPDGGRGEAA
jgi:DICT domain-containing protein